MQLMLLMAAHSPFSQLLSMTLTTRNILNTISSRSMSILTGLSVKLEFGHQPTSATHTHLFILIFVQIEGAYKKSVHILKKHANTHTHTDTLKHTHILDWLTKGPCEVETWRLSRRAMTAISVSAAHHLIYNLPWGDQCLPASASPNTGVAFSAIQASPRVAKFLPTTSRSLHSQPKPVIHAFVYLS